MNTLIDVLDTGGALEFRAGARLAGRYHYRDAFKPFFGTLNTPKGHNVALVSPHDHKHHKGLMYALRAKDVNFWEEVTSLPDEVVGRQRHERFDLVMSSNEEAGFRQVLTWEAVDGTRQSFLETRSVRVRETPQGYQWTWETTLAAQRDLTLIMSQWSAVLKDGRKINYHGLGLRFVRAFGGTGNNAIFVDGKKSPSKKAWAPCRSWPPSTAPSIPNGRNGRRRERESVLPRTRNNPTRCSCWKNPSPS